MRRRLAAAALAGAAVLSGQAPAGMPTAGQYLLYCSGCHGADGTGAPEAGIPDLRDAGRYVAIPLGREYLIEVPGLSQSRLDDATAANLLNYILERFSREELPSGFVPYTAAEVTRFRGDRASDAVVRRRAILEKLKAMGQPLPPAAGASSK